MPVYANPSESKSDIVKVSKVFPLLFSTIFLFFVYVLQHPLSLLFVSSSIADMYGLSDWLKAYSFVIISTVIFLFFLYIGISGPKIKVNLMHYTGFKSGKKISLVFVLFMFVLFFLWSYVMLKLRIGMTIYGDFEPLPFKLIGLLVYGRLILQPCILLYICLKYKYSKLKPLIIFLMIILGIFASLTSGSRFISIMFAIPLLFTFEGKSKYLLFGAALLINITIATITRIFFLPFLISDFYVHMLASGDAQSDMLEHIFLLPFSYIVVRTMGIAELLMTLKFGSITSTFSDALLSFMASFFPFIHTGNLVNAKTIYGVDQDTLTGLGLDFFSNLWLNFGGSFILYPIGVALVGLILGKCYRFSCLAGRRFGFKEFPFLVFVLVFLIIFDGRTNLLIFILVTLWFTSRRSLPVVLYSVRKALVLRPSLFSRNLRD